MYINRLHTISVNRLIYLILNAFNRCVNRLTYLFLKKIQSNFLDYILSKETISLCRFTL